MQFPDCRPRIGRPAASQPCRTQSFRSSAVHRGGDNEAPSIQESSMRLSNMLISLAICAVFTAPALADEPRGTISVEGRGEVLAAPDTAFITSGVTTQGATAREA